MKKRPIRLQTNLYWSFALFTLIVIAALWMLQNIALDYYYYEKETQKVEALGDLVAERWRNVRFSQPAMIKFYQDEIPVRIFNRAGAAESEGVLQVSDPDPLSNERLIQRYEASGKDVYISRIADPNVPNTSFLIYGRKIANRVNAQNDLYIYIVHTLGPLDSMRAIFRQQLFVLSLMIISVTLPGGKIR